MEHCALRGHWLFSTKADRSYFWSIACPKDSSFFNINCISGYCNLQELLVRLLCKTIVASMWMQKCFSHTLQADEQY